jgi:MoxR-like ATPase
MQTELVRLQCYPGLDEAKTLYEWHYQKQLLYIQSNRQEGKFWQEVQKDIFSAEFLLSRPLLKAFMAKKHVVMLIDELDKSDDELESFLLEALSDYQVSIPELGTVKARHIPLVILTSNNTRDFSDAMKRRCLHLYIPYPTIDQEIAIILMKIPQIKKKLAARMVEFIQTLRKMPLKKTPSIAETLDWVKTLILLNSEMDRKAVAISLSVLLKYEQDVATVEKKLDSLLPDNPDTEEDEAFAEEPPVNEKKHEQPEWLSRFEF